MRGLLLRDCYPTRGRDLTAISRASIPARQCKRPCLSSAFTKSVIAAAGIRVIEWPPCSPDLNPIETVWDDIKDYIQEHYRQVHSSYRRLRAAIQEAWESITHERAMPGCD